MRAYYTIGGQFHGSLRCGQMLKQIDDREAATVYRVLMDAPPGLLTCNYCGDRAERVELAEELGLRKLGFVERLRLLFG